MKRKKRSFNTRIERAVGLPDRFLSSKSRIDILGQEEMSVENAVAITEYEEDIIKITLLNGALTICGEALRIDMFLDDYMLIRGHIGSISFN